MPFTFCETFFYFRTDCIKVISGLAGKYKLEEFSEADLLVNITHHKLVPQHDVLDAEQKKLLLER
jgi:DNA-directed RNA polymerases I, II, and III subunit RPABC1